MPKVHQNDNLLMKVLIYGIPGSGKTTLASTAAEHGDMGKVLFLSIEGGMLSVPNNPDIMVEEIRNTPEKAAIDQVRDLFFALVAKNIKQTPWVENINTVVIDSGTELMTLVLEKIAKDAGRQSGMPFLQDYGQSTAVLKQTFRWFRDLPYNVIVTSLVQTVYDGKGDNAPVKSIEPMFTEKLREAVKGYFDHIWYAYRLEGKPDSEGTVQPDSYHLLTRPAAKFFGKTRGQNFSQALGARVDNPNLAVIYDLLLQTEGKAK